LSLEETIKFLKKETEDVDNFIKNCQKTVFENREPNANKLLYFAKKSKILKQEEVSFFPLE